jgi:hypothetical protein
MLQYSAGIDGSLSLKHKKVNFMLSTWTMPDTYSLDPSTQTRTDNRFKLNAPMMAKEILDKLNITYYLVLNTDHEKSDFAIALWYPDDDDVIKQAEAMIQLIKRQNNPTLIQVTGMQRGRLHPLTLQRMYPDLPEKPAIRGIGEGTTQAELKQLESEHIQVGFMNRSYLTTSELKFKDSWYDLSEAQQAGMLKDLDNFASSTFPGLVESVLIDSPLNTCDLIYASYLDTYSDLADFASLLKQLKIARYLDEGFGKTTICNHTSREALESPQSMVRRFS